MNTLISLTYIARIIILISLSIPSLAHFMVQYPIPRGYNEDTARQFPCGGMNQVSSQRTLYPITGGAIGIEIWHERNNFQVLIAFESEPTTKFKTVLRKTFTEIGMGKFCMTNVNMPTELDIREGQNATIQVISNSVEDGVGGYYSCSDITFGISAFDFDICQNSTGISISSARINGNANETNPGDKPSKQSAAPHNWNSDSLRLSILPPILLTAAIMIMNF